MNSQRKKSFFKIGVIVMLVTLSLIGGAPAQASTLSAIVDPFKQVGNTYIGLGKQTATVYKDGTASLLDSVSHFFSTLFGKKDTAPVAEVPLPTPTPTHTYPAYTPQAQATEPKPTTSSSAYKPTVTTKTVTNTVYVPVAPAQQAASVQTSGLTEAELEQRLASFRASLPQATTTYVYNTSSGGASFYNGVSQSDVTNLQSQITCISNSTATTSGTTSTSCVRNMFSASSPLAYNSSTGNFSTASGYSIPLTASTTQWSTFYNTPSTRITAGTNLCWSGNTLNVCGVSGGGLSTTTLNSLAKIEVGNGNCATGCNASAVGYHNIVSGVNSSAFGSNTRASGNGSFASGSGSYSTYHSCGVSTASGDYSVSVGTVSGYYGGANTASGNYSSAIGISNCASGVNSSAFGSCTCASGNCSFAAGSGSCSSYHPNGVAIASGCYSVSVGTASGFYGPANTASGSYSSAFGISNIASCHGSSASGLYNIASGEDSSAFGAVNIACGYSSSAFGSGNCTSCPNSSAFGSCNIACGNCSSAFGYHNTASACFYSSAFGYGNCATGNYSNAFGSNNRVSCVFSSAFGFSNSALCSYSSAFGYSNTASGCYSSAFGSGLINPTACSAQFGSRFYCAGAPGSYCNAYMSISLGGVNFCVPGTISQNGGAPSFASDRNLKENFQDVDKQSILDKINALPMQQWNYKGQDSNMTHIAPIAQDFYSLFNLNNSSTSISAIDPAGVALVGIQALSARLDALSGSSTFSSLSINLNSVASSSPSVLSTLQSFGAEVIDGVAWLKEVWVEKLSVKDIKVENGITIKDKVTGQYYCITIVNGSMQNNPGECSDTMATSISVSPTEPAVDSNANSTSTDSSTSTSTASTTPEIDPTSSATSTTTESSDASSTASSSSTN